MKLKLIQLTAMLSLLATGGVALAQDIQERTIRFGHLNNPDHPTSMGVQEVRRDRRRQERRQDHGEGIRQQPARQRAAAAVGAAGRRAGDARRVHDVADRHRQGIRPASTSRSCSATPSRPTRWSTARSARCSAPSCRKRAWSCSASSTWAFATSPTASGPITKGEDLEGLKLRVIPNPVFLETFKTFKANPMPMPFAELYGALESKAVDGQENPYAVILSSKFYEVQQVRQRHQPRVRDQPGPDQQALLGPAVAGRAEAAAGRRDRSAELPAHRQPRGLRQGAGRAARPRAWSTTRSRRPKLARMRAAVQAGLRQVRRLVRPGRRDPVQDRAGTRLQALTTSSQRAGPRGFLTAGLRATTRRPRGRRSPPGRT